MFTGLAKRPKNSDHGRSRARWAASTSLIGCPPFPADQMSDIFLNRVLIYFLNFELFFMLSKQLLQG